MRKYHVYPYWGIDAPLRAFARPDLVTQLDVYPVPCIDPEGHHPRMNHAYDSYSAAARVGQIDYYRPNAQAFDDTNTSLPSKEFLQAYRTPMGVHILEQHREPILHANTFWSCNREFKDAQLHREYMVSNAITQLLKR